MASDVIASIEELDDCMPVWERNGPPVPSGEVVLYARDRAPSEELKQVCQRKRPLVSQLDRDACGA